LQIYEFFSKFQNLLKKVVVSRLLVIRFNARRGAILKYNNGGRFSGTVKERPCG
jgi:hypothetical protein